MPKTSNFRADLQDGKVAERRVQRYLNTKYNGEHHFLQAEGKNAKYDLWCLDCSEKIEIKYDRRAQETGNLAIEKNLFAKTASQTTVYVVEDIAYLWDTKELWNTLKQLAAEKRTRFLFGGDRNANPMILVKFQDVIKTAVAVELGETDGI